MDHALIANFQCNLSADTPEPSLPPVATQITKLADVPVPMQDTTQLPIATNALLDIGEIVARLALSSVTTAVFAMMVLLAVACAVAQLTGGVATALSPLFAHAATLPKVVSF